MLTHLSISNLAIVEDVQVEFKPGFNVLTGETGAGKSILIGAISLLAGQKAKSESVRKDTPKAYVEGVIELSAQSPALTFLEDKGIACEDASVVIKRMISRDGKNKVMINHQVATVNLLQGFSSFWLDVTSQHAQQDLKDPISQLKLLDDMGDHADAHAAYQHTFGEIKTKLREKAKLEALAKRAREEKDFLSFQLKELTQSELSADELEYLENEHSKIKHNSEIQSLVENALNILDDEAGIVSKLNRLRKTLIELSRFDASYANHAEEIEQVISSTSDLSQTLSRENQQDLAPYEIDEINERISYLQGLVKKYGSLERAIDKRDELQKVLSLAEDDSEELWQLDQDIQALGTTLVKHAKDLQKVREQTAKTVSAHMTTEIQKLGMERAQLEIVFEAWGHEPSTIDFQDKTFHPLGSQSALFLFTPNVGEGAKPLALIASGGELSRVMLAIKSIGIECATNQDKTYLFDEVDAGVGGPTAERIGQRMHTLARTNTQVLNVTHLAQVAAYADHHAKVEKKLKQGRTRTQISFLNRRLQEEELARMIGGIEISATTKAVASELLEKKDKDALQMKQGQL